MPRLFHKQLSTASNEAPHCVACPSLLASPGHTPLSRSSTTPTHPPLTSGFQWKIFKNPIFTKQTFCKSFPALVQPLAVLLNKQVRRALFPTKSPKLLRDAF